MVISNFVYIYITKPGTKVWGKSINLEHRGSIPERYHTGNCTTTMNDWHKRGTCKLDGNET